MTEVCPELPLPARIEALLLSGNRPLPERRLAELLGLADNGAVKTAIEGLNSDY